LRADYLGRSRGSAVPLPRSWFLAKVVRSLADDEMPKSNWQGRIKPWTRALKDGIGLGRALNTGS